MEIDRFRLGIARDGMAMSSIWIAHQHHDDLYVGIRKQAGYKASLHASGWVRLAFGEQFVPRLATSEQPNPDRAILKWRRPITPSVGFVHALSLMFPTDLMKSFEPAIKSTTKKPILWIDPAPAGQATEIGFFYTKEPPNELETKLLNIGMLIGYVTLDSGESVCLVGRYQPFDAARYVPALSKARVRSLSDRVDQLGQNESLGGLSGFFILEPEIGRGPSMIEATGFDLQRTSS